MHRRTPKATFAAGLAFAFLALSLSLPSTAGAATCVSTPEGLTARWPGDGNAIEVAHGRNGTPVGDTTYGSGVVDQAFSFDGDGDSITVPDDPAWTLGTRDFTVDLWVNFEADSSNPVALIAHDQGYGAQPKWLLWKSQGNLELYDNSVVIDTPWSPVLDQWYHVAVTRAGSTFTLYLDGLPAATASATKSIVDPAGPLTLGSAENDFWLDGSIDEPEIYQRALSAAEIKSIHDQGSAARCSITKSSLTLQADPHVLPGGTASLSGILSLSGGAAASGLPIELSRSVNGAGAEALGTIPTQADGSFALGDNPPDGTIVYEASFPGGVDVSAERARVTVEVSKGASVLKVSTSRNMISLGKHVTVTAHLTGGSTNRVVTIYATPAGGSTQALRRAKVDTNGRLAVKTDPSRNTTYHARYTGDAEWTADTSPSKEVQVSPRWVIKTIGGYATVRGVRLYHYSARCGPNDDTGCPSALFRLAPGHAGERVIFEGKYCANGRCYDDEGSFRLNRRSLVSLYIYYGDRSTIGWKLSFRLRFSGDSDHAPSTSAWVKTKVTT